MDAETWARVKQIFSEAVVLNGEGRAAYLDQAIDGEAEVRAEVEALLRSNDEAEDFIEKPAFSVSDALPTVADPIAGKVVGHYRIVRELGRGGMGAVFLGERDDGEFQQEVAIKVVSSALLGRESLDRFRQERQILARLNHPNIARLIDGGLTDDGLPYLAMEYVEGDTLVEYADKHELSIDARLRIFLKICRAFAYAHASLIVHRDIKPSNILVTSDGEPKLLDFGLAKVLDIQNSDIRTATNFRALTPAYASPEQIRGDAITTASDVYSLGVVLYELLTGTRPFNYELMSLQKMLEISSVSTPTLPSQVVARRERDNETGNARHVASSELKGDLDNIVLMAMRAEPARRFRSVEQLASDIDRHLSDLPITATDDTFGYRAAKFVKRHRLGIASAAVMALVVIAGIVGILWRTRQARQAQQKAESIVTFLGNTLGSAAPSGKGIDVRMVDILDDASQRAVTQLADDQAVLADVRFTLGRGYIGLTEYEKAESELRSALDASIRANQEVHPTTAVIMAWLGMALAFGNKSEEGERYSRTSVDLLRQLNMQSSEAAGYALFGLGLNLNQKGEFQEALPVAVAASEIIRDHLGEHHGYHLATLNIVALTRQGVGDIDGAETVFRHALDLGKNADPRYRIFSAQASAFLGRLLIKKEKLDEAESVLNESERIYRDVLGDQNANMGYVRLLKGEVLYQKGDLAGAETAFTSSCELLKTLPPENPSLMQARKRLQNTLERAGKTPTNQN